MSSHTSAGSPISESVYIRDIYNGNPPEYIGDVIEIARLSNHRITAKIRKLFDGKLHQFEGKFIIQEQIESFDHWIDGYSEGVKGYIAANIEDQSREQVFENAKVGLVAYRHDGDVVGTGSAFVFEPVNHLLTVSFNRKLALDRLSGYESSEAHRLWYSCLSHAVNSSFQEMTFINPSQLFVEFGLMTTDGYIPITEKATRTSVYAMRNKGEPLKTCGLETGLNWVDVICEGDKEDTATLDVKSGLLAGLKRRFPMPDWDENEDQIKAKTTALVLQTLHLNTAIIGTCKIPYTKDELGDELKGKICGGLDHTNLSFIHVSECQEYIDKYSDSTSWHGSAMARLKAISDHFK